MCALGTVGANGQQTVTSAALSSFALILEHRMADGDLYNLLTIGRSKPLHTNNGSSGSQANTWLLDTSALALSVPNYNRSQYPAACFPAP